VVDVRPGLRDDRGGQQRGEVRALIGQIDPTLAGRLSGHYDPDFQRAKEAFQARYSVKDLLS
jgi:hypothetical protein